MFLCSVLGVWLLVLHLLRVFCMLAEELSVLRSLQLPPSLRTVCFWLTTLFHHTVKRSSFLSLVRFIGLPLGISCSSLISNTVIDLSWKIAHGVLYTAQRLSSFGYDLSTASLCGHNMESLDHLFFYCPLASSVLSWLQLLLFRAAPLAPPFVCRHALFGFSEDELCVVPLFLVYAINVGKFYIWMACNDFRFRDAPPSAIYVIESIKCPIPFHLPLFFRRFHSSRRHRYFVLQWGAHGTIASISDGNLSVHFYGLALALVAFVGCNGCFFFLSECVSLLSGHLCWLYWLWILFE